MRERERGIVLINVLVVVALGSAIILLMFNTQRDMIGRAQDATALTRAEAIAFGAEESVRLALLADMTNAPETDHLFEPWALAQQEETTLATGRFSVAIDDAQSRFNLNGIGEPGLLQQRTLLRVLTLAGLPETLAPTLQREISRSGPFRTLEEIDAVDPDQRVALAPYVSLLPQPGGLNLNTASAEMMTAVLGNPGAARQLVARRARTGFLTRGDLTDAGLLALNGAGLTSDVFDVSILIEIDGIELVLVSRLARISRPGLSQVIVTDRRFQSSAAPGTVP